MHHEARAAEALREVEALQARLLSQSEEQERLKGSVNSLLAMFGATEAAAANTSLVR